VAYGTNMDRVSRVTVDGEEVPAVVVGSDRIEFGVPEDASDGCVEIFSDLDTLEPEPITLKQCPPDEKEVVN
jgi:hypothetical protein